MMSSILKPFVWFADTFGLVSIHKTGRNAYLIILARVRISCVMSNETTANTDMF